MSAALEGSLSLPDLPSKSRQDAPEEWERYDRELRRCLEGFRKNARATNQALNIPVFSAHRNGAQQIIPTITSTKVLWTHVAMDSHAHFDTAQSRFMPLAGLYHFYAQVRWGLDTGPGGKHRLIKIQKNDASVEDARLAVVYLADTLASPTLFVQSMLSMNGTDYVDVAVYHDAGSDRLIEGEPTQSYFHGYKVGD